MLLELTMKQQTKNARGQTQLFFANPGDGMVVFTAQYPNAEAAGFDVGDVYKVNFDRVDLPAAQPHSVEVVAPDEQ